VAFLLFLTQFSACGPEDRPDEIDGYYVWGGEVHTLQPCSSQYVYWVSAAESLRSHLAGRYRELTNRPYEPVFIRLTGVTGDVPDSLSEGFPGEYDGLITVHSVVEIRSIRPGDCKEGENIEE